MAASQAGSKESMCQDSENVVLYKLFPEVDLEDIEESIIFKLNRLGAECMHIASEISAGYIWNNEIFNVAVPKQKDADIRCLKGCTDFKDNIEDEWFIVYICLELTRRIKGLIVSVEDSDGQFLLIEAAHEIPKWLKPETSPNRVFLFGGKVHIIPTPRHPGEVGVYPVGTPSLLEALSLVRSDAQNTQASDEVQDSIMSRTEKYRSDMQSCLHHAHCRLPLLAAHVIHYQPQLVAAAVHALSERLPSDMKICQKMPTFRPGECVTRRVALSKFLYAKLLYENFNPPRHSGFKLPAESHSEYSAHELGMKLTCGLEIVAAQSTEYKSENSTYVSYQKDPRWSQFIHSLTESGYFREEIEGSQLHIKLMSSAKDFFVSMLEREKGDGDGSVRSKGAAIHRIIRDVPCAADTYRAEESTLPPADDDSWLQISQQELDGLLSKYTETSRKGRAQVMTSGSANNLDDVVYGLKSFVNKVSGPEGVEFPWAADDSREVAFDPQEVVDNVKKLLSALGDEGAEDLDDSDLESGSDTHSLTSVDEEEKEEMLHIMEEMDKELATTEVGKSFLKQSTGPRDVESQDDHREGSKGDLQPVDVDLNLVSNILDSFASQCGEPGPASNILQTMGIQLPLEADNSDDD